MPAYGRRGHADRVPTDRRAAMCCVPRVPCPRSPLPPGGPAVTSMAAGLAAALAGAVALDASYLLQHTGTRDRPALDLRWPRRSAAVLLRSPPWPAGLA